MTWKSGPAITEEVAVRLLPEEGRKELGRVENWRQCFLQIRCSIIFGWLLFRRQRTFRAFAYYLYRYWLCVRQEFGTPVGQPPTAEEREDFETLVKALASAYKPYLTDQLARSEIFAASLHHALDTDNCSLYSSAFLLLKARFFEV